MNFNSYIWDTFYKTKNAMGFDLLIKTAQFPLILGYLGLSGAFVNYCLQAPLNLSKTIWASLNKGCKCKYAPTMSLDSFLLLLGSVSNETKNSNANYKNVLSKLHPSEHCRRLKSFELLRGLLWRISAIILGHVHMASSMNILLAASLNSFGK